MNTTNWLRRKMCAGVLGSAGCGLIMVLGGALFMVFGTAAAFDVGGFLAIGFGIFAVIGLLFSGAGVQAMRDSFTNPIWED